MVNTADPFTWEAVMEDGEVLPFSISAAASLFYTCLPKEEIFVSVNQINTGEHRFVSLNQAKSVLAGARN
jgi:hypothetical protein